MTRLFIDNNISRSLVDSIKDFYNFNKYELEIVHLTERFKPNADDSLFVKALGDEGEWIIISCDLGNHPHIKEKLPKLCQQHNVTCIQLTSAISQGRSIGHAHCLHAIILNRDNVSTFPAGTIIRVGLKKSKRDFVLYEFRVRSMGHKNIL